MTTHEILNIVDAGAIKAIKYYFDRKNINGSDMVRFAPK